MKCRQANRAPRACGFPAAGLRTDARHSPRSVRQPTIAARFVPLSVNTAKMLQRENLFSNPADQCPAPDGYEIHVGVTPHATTARHRPACRGGAVFANQNWLSLYPLATVRLVRVSIQRAADRCELLGHAQPAILRTTAFEREPATRFLSWRIELPPQALFLHAYPLPVLP
jgi:hypothetical protein